MTPPAQNARAAVRISGLLPPSKILYIRAAAIATDISVRSRRGGEIVCAVDTPAVQNTDAHGVLRAGKGACHAAETVLPEAGRTILNAYIPRRTKRGASTAADTIFRRVKTPADPRHGGMFDTQHKRY